MYLFLPFGYFRALAKAAHAREDSPVLPRGRDFLRAMLRAWPLGAFYSIVPLALAWGLGSVFSIMGVAIVLPIIWGLAIMVSLSLTAVALDVVPDDPERYFLSLDFENVLERWWQLRQVLMLPAVTCYGVVALLGGWFYGFGFFLALEVLVRIVAQTSREDL